jgi:hypothetical protein
LWQGISYGKVCALASNAEIDTIERTLRDLLQSLGLDWLLAEIDLTVAEGRAVVRRKGGDEPFSGEFDAGKGEVTAEPYSAADRVGLIIDALQRTLVEAPALIDETERLLTDPGATSPPEIHFAHPATGEEEWVFPVAAEREQARRAAQELSELLAGLAARLQ